MGPAALSFRPVATADGEALAALRVEAMRLSLERVGRFDPDRARLRFLDAFEAHLKNAFDQSGVGAVLAGPRHIERFTPFD